MKKKLSLLGFGSQCPPDEIHVRVYFLQQGSTIEEATEFFNNYSATLWKARNGLIVRDWKQIAWSWIWYR
ncbi:hypothetical protein [Dyadobacter sp. 676]|uniref:Uncharacterized protein n=1 Tax=Dyadobacter sp. 676 TaxID=3088362 RepID=A0AAU8FN28_9BACT